MKKFYYSLLMVAIWALLGSNVVSAQGLTCESWTKASWPWDTWGEVKHGDTIHCEGAYSQTLEVDGTTYEIVQVELNLLHFDANWATVDAHKNIIANAEVGDLASGVVNKDFVVPCWFPLTSTDPDGKWLVQLRAWYGTDGVINNDINTEFANAWVTVVEGGITPPADVPAGLYISTWEGAHGAYGTYGDVVHGEKIHIDGTFSQQFEKDGNMYDVKSVRLSILGFTSGWASNNHSQVITIHDANNGDLSCSIINSDLVVADSLPLNSELPEGDFYIFQVRADYGDDTNPSVESLWANAWMSIVDGTATAVHTSFVENGIQAFPNPVKAGEQLRISSNHFRGDVHVKIFNLAGVTVYDQVRSVNDLRINTGDFTPGLYHVAVRSGNQMAIQKLVVTQ